MVSKKRKSNSTDKVLTEKTVRLTRQTINKKEEFKDNVKASLPVLSEEKLYSDDYAVKISEDNKVEDKVLRVVIPKIEVRCEPLNVQKIINLENNEVVTDVIKINKRKSACKSKKTDSGETKSSKSSFTKKLGKNNAGSSKSQPEENLKNSGKKLTKTEEAKLYKTSVISTLKTTESNDSPRQKKIKIVINGSQVTLEKESFLNNSNHIQEKSMEQNYQVNASQSSENQSSSNLNVNTSNTKDAFYLSLCNLDDEAALIELNDINLEELAPSLESLFDEEPKMKLEDTDEKNKNIGEDNGSNSLFEINNLTNSRDINQNNFNQTSHELGNSNKITLQAAVEAFMKSPQLIFLKENTALKKGLCFTWLSNNYMCSSEQCLYSHNALSLFIKKLRQYPSKFIMIVVISMRNDILFVDVIMAAFKILSERKMPIVWVTFLIYFVFYVTEPSDSRFLKFWVNAARFFCQLDRNYAAANGFASLLSIFSQGEKSEEWKIIEFIKLIKQPPVQISITYALLQPVLKMNIPVQLLTETIETCIETKEDLLKVYSAIIPKVPYMTSPIQVIELLLRFCKTLEDEGLITYADDLKRRLQSKVLSFKTKIIQRDYPLTAFFQESLSGNVKENCFITEPRTQEEKSETELGIVGFNNNYFELQQDFYNLMAETIKSPDSIPSPFRNKLKNDKVLGTYGKEEDVGLRQINRLRQFFKDCQFDLLGKYLNEVRSTVTEPATEVILKSLFHMKITLQQVVDLVKIIVLHCKSENAVKIIANVSVTLILNLVRINEWEKAHIIASLCKEKEINLAKGKVFCLGELNTVTQCRIVLLLIEIYAYKSDYPSALDLVKEYSLFSSDNSLWKVTWKPHDEIIRIRILEDLLRQIVSSQLTKVAYDLFENIWKAQNQLFGPVDLRKSINELLILLLNQGNEDAINLYEKIKTEVQLNETTARGILVTLVRQNRLSAAKSLLHSLNQIIYFLPEINLNSINVTVLSFWLEEEMYVMFDAFFDLLVAKNQNNMLTDFDNLEVNIKLLKPTEVSCSNLRPLCLGIIKPFFKDACSRIQRVLQYQFNPPLKLMVKSSNLKLDKHALKVYLKRRMNRISC